MCLKRRAKSKVIDCQYNVDSLTSQSHSLCHFFFLKYFKYRKTNCLLIDIFFFIHPHHNNKQTNHQCFGLEFCGKYEKLLLKLLFFCCENSSKVLEFGFDDVFL